MKSPVVIDKLQDYGNSWTNECGFLFKEIEETSCMLSELGTQYPEIAEQWFPTRECNLWISSRTTEVPGYNGYSGSNRGSRRPQQPQRQTAPQQNQPPQPPQEPQPPQQPTQPPNPPSPPQEPKPHSSTHDQIKKILEVQAEALNFMNEVENFTGTKQDRQYIYITEMLTQCLIKLDKINCTGDIRTAKEDAIRSINRCIVVLEIKAPDVPASDNAGAENEDPENEEPKYNENAEPMHVDYNGDSTDNSHSPGMDVDGAYGH